MHTQDIRIAIVGAGIAGLTVAAALARAGVGCRVFEQAAELTAVGAGIQLAPNATRLLHRLGLGSHLSEVGVRPTAIQMRRWNDNALLIDNQLGDACEKLFGAPYYAVHRADLHSGLLSLVPPDAVRLGSRCVRAEQRAEEVVLEFADGSVHAADVVIAADGIRSALRGVLITDAPRFSGQIVYRGLVAAGRLPELVRRRAVTIWLGPDQHLVCYPIAAGELISFVASAPSECWGLESWDVDGGVDEVREAYADWHDEPRSVLAATDAVKTFALHDRDHLPTWSSDRITLVGDAAHPMLPFGAQGAAQGIEDAVALATCLLEVDRTGIAAALARYESVRKPRVDEVHRFIRANEKNHHYDDGAEQRERDAAMGDAWSLAGQRWLFGYDAEQAAAAA